MLVEALVLAVLGWIAIVRSLKPVESLSKDIEQRSPEHLGPVDRPDIPREVAPLVTALNDLFARVVTASAAEKAFIADAAHQLRTPLTVLRTETELALLEDRIRRSSRACCAGCTSPPRARRGWPTSCCRRRAPSTSATTRRWSAST